MSTYHDHTSGISLTLRDRTASVVVVRDTQSTHATVNVSQRGMPGRDGDLIQQEAIDELRDNDCWGTDDWGV